MRAEERGGCWYWFVICNVLRSPSHSLSDIVSFSLLCGAESFNSVRWARAQDCRLSTSIQTNVRCPTIPIIITFAIRPPTRPSPSRPRRNMSSRVEMCGGELVCRLVAATPPYLYSPAGLPHCFFFSELLRGLVEARAKRPASPPPSVTAHQKRFRLAGPDSAFSTPLTHINPGNGGSSKGNTLSTSRLLPRLQQIYTTIGEEKRKEPLPAVIGLELVVDYVKHERKDPKQ